MRLQSVRVRNFKAIVDSKTVKLGPLTALIGNNGTGKSSLIEALETYQSILRDGLDIAIFEQSLSNLPGASNPHSPRASSKTALERNRLALAAERVVPYMATESPLALMVRNDPTR